MRKGVQSIDTCLATKIPDTLSAFAKLTQSDAKHTWSNISEVYIDAYNAVNTVR